jgi:hypothetical protein
MTVFIAATLFLSILGLVWVMSAPHLASLVLDLLLVLVCSQDRSSLMGTWFSASR